ncbi:MAG: glycosyltransferase family 4 protein [Anaerolineales bacterium]|nr:glycosyltransferase family 4 protein [Anaerolineales bacterium]
MKPKNKLDNSFASTVSGWGDPRFAARARFIPIPGRLDKVPRGKFSFADEARLFWRVLRAARQERVLLLFSSRGYLKPELLATAVIGLWPKRWRPDIIFYGEMYEPNTDWRRFIEPLLMKLADRAVFRYAVHSQAEVPVFAHLWGIDESKVRSCSFYHKKAGSGVTVTDKPRGRHIFAGGTSFRDYEPLLDAARLLPDHEFVIATNRLDNHPQIPPNVRAGLVSPSEFDTLIDTAAAVVVPLRRDVHRIIGMLTYLQAMWAKKPTIVSDTLGVREYVADGETGLIVTGTPESYVAAIEWVLDPANNGRIQQMCTAAHRAVNQQFTIENHVSRLLAIVDEAWETVPAQR